MSDTAAELAELVELVEPAELAEADAAATGTDQPPAFEVPDPPETGDPDVDSAINAVAAAMDGPLEEQVAVYEAAHRTLQDRLADVEG